jgi:magnesium transporter
LKATKFLKKIYPSAKWSTKKVLQVNPTINTTRKDAPDIKISVYNYDNNSLNELHYKNIAQTFPFLDSTNTTWINIDGLRRKDVDSICAHFNIHPLIAEDILSVGQRPKFDEIGGILYCLLNMLYFNADGHFVETEQISVVLGKNFVISFQEDASRDVFNPLRDKLKISGSKVRQGGADFLFYSLIDLIVDNFFIVMEKLGDEIEIIEENIIRDANTRTLAQISLVRKEMIILKRNVTPVRELVNGILRSESTLIDEKTEKYFKDIYDHVVQATDLAENYRDITINLQDLYLNNLNLKMNNVMKVMAIVTCLLAPATVIGGIFGMNFSSIPWIHNQFGFYIAVGFMLLIPVWMLYIFRKKGWF